MPRFRKCAGCQLLKPESAFVEGQLHCGSCATSTASSTPSQLPPPTTGASRLADSRRFSSSIGSIDATTPKSGSARYRIVASSTPNTPSTSARERLVLVSSSNSLNTSARLQGPPSPPPYRSSPRPDP
eukprot:EG_transcript_48232